MIKIIFIMRYKIIFLMLLVSVIGCKKESGITGPGTTSTPSDSKVRNGILYTASASTNKLGILDTLDMSLILTNQNQVKDTVEFGWGVVDLSVINDQGTTIYTSPWRPYVFIGKAILNPNQSEIIRDKRISMIDIISTPIKPGFYLFKWNACDDLLFQLYIYCN